MNRMIITLVAAVVALFPLRLLASSYSVMDLGFGYGRGINQNGDTVGSLFLPGYPGIHAVAWNTGGIMTDLGTLGGAASEATAINRFGQVVGYSMVPGSAQNAHAFISYNCQSSP